MGFLHRQPEGGGFDPRILGALREQEQEPPRKWIGPSNPKTAEDFGALLQSPFVRDTLSMLMRDFGRDNIFFHSLTGEQMGHEGQPEPGHPHAKVWPLLYPNRIYMHDYWKDRPHYQTGEMEPGDYAQNLLVHELIHLLDYGGGIPEEARSKAYKDINERGPSWKGAREDIAHAGEVAMSTFRGIHQKDPALQPGAVALLEWFDSLFNPPEKPPKRTIEK